MIVKMIQDLGNNGEDAKNVYQRPIRTKEQTEMNNPLEGVSSRITEAEERINDLEDRMVEITASVIPLFISPSVLLISVCLFFSSSRSLVNISCIFSIFISILFPRSWIIFTIIILNYFSGRLHISTSLIAFLGFYLVPSSGTKLSTFSSLLLSVIWFLF